jgi:cytochrome P450
MWDPSIYPNPDKFDPYRFINLRQVPGYETVAQTVSPSPEHMGFGLGKHACPGRFFAINEVKIALCHILLKYDVELARDCTPSVRKYGLSLGADPSARLRVWRRREEMVLV